VGVGWEQESEGGFEVRKKPPKQKNYLKKKELTLHFFPTFEFNLIG
jgi:hypothetical protein